MNTTPNVGEDTSSRTLQGEEHSDMLKIIIGEHTIVRRPCQTDSIELRDMFRDIVDRGSRGPIIRCTEEHSDAFLCQLSSEVTSPFLTIVGSGPLGTSLYWFQDSIALRAALERAELIFKGNGKISFDAAMRMGIRSSGLTTVTIEIGNIN